MLATGKSLSSAVVLIRERGLHRLPVASKEGGPAEPCRAGTTLDGSLAFRFPTGHCHFTHLECGGNI